MDVTIYKCNFTRPPSNGLFSESVDQTFLFDHGQVAFATSISVVIAQCATHFLVVHFSISVQFHSTPRSGKLISIADLEDAVSFIDPTDNLWVVGPVVNFTNTLRADFEPIFI